MNRSKHDAGEVHRHLNAGRRSQEQRADDAPVRAATTSSAES